MPVTYDNIATTTLGSATNSITFSSIPSTYTDLRVVWTLSGLSTGNDPALRFNGSSSTLYSYTYLRGNGASASSSRLSGEAQIYCYAGTGGATGTPTFMTIDVFSYAGSTNKTCLITTSADQNGSGITASSVGLFRSTSAITSLTLLITPSGNQNIGTTATLYGIKNA